MKSLPVIWALLLAEATAGITAVPHPAASFEPPQTVLWSPLFQATWDEATKSYGGLVKVEPANKLIEDLESFHWDAGKVMPEGAWKTWSGPADFEFLNKANAEAAQMLGEPKGPFKLDRATANAEAAYGLLNREVTFRKKFLPSMSAPLVFKAGGRDTPVRFFGMRNEAEGGAVRVISFNGPSRSHAVQIRCQEGDDTVVLYLPPGPQSFSTACRWLRTWASQPSQDMEADSLNDPSLHEGDEIHVPYLDFDFTANFAHALGGWMTFEQPPQRRVMQAEQRTRFRLHEAGASVRSEAKLVIQSFGGSPIVPLPRKFIYDRPFFVFLWREGAEWPYFGAWVGDTSGMKLWSDPPAK